MAWEITVNTCDPLKARQWFTLRDPVNWGIIILVFVPLVFVLQIFLPYFICDVIAIAAAFSLYFFGLHKRAIGIECPSCGKYILTNTPWICGVCGAKNLRVDDFPFVGRCENKDCGVEPKAYQCHHCEKLIFFTPDRQRINYAKCVNIPDKSKPVKNKRDKDTEEVVKLDKGIQLSERRVKKAKLDVELKGLNATLEPVKFKTIKERLRSGVMSKSELDDEVRLLKAEADEEFKNDPVGREKRYRQIEEEATGLL